MMFSYDRDRRVRRVGNGYTVTSGGTDYRVLPNQALGWGIYTGPNLDLVPAAGGGFAVGFRSADAAIAALIGAARGT